MILLWGRISLFRFTRPACLAVLFIMWPIWAKMEMPREMQENTFCTEHAYRVQLNEGSRDQFHETRTQPESKVFFAEVDFSIASNLTRFAMYLAINAKNRYF